MSKTLGQLKVAYGDWLAVNETRGAKDSQQLPESIRADLANAAIRELLRAYDTEFGEHTEVFQTTSQKLDYSPFVDGGFLRPISLWYVNPTATADSDDNIVVVDFYDKKRFDAEFPAAGLFGDPAPMGAGTYGQAGLSDTPTNYTVWAKKIQLGPVPNRQLSMFCSAFRLLPDLEDDDEENIVTVELWEYVLFKGLALAEMFGIEDSRMAGWEARAKMIAEDAAMNYVRRNTTAKRLSQSEEPG
jgi:hypothetical protein